MKMTREMVDAATPGELQTIFMDDPGMSKPGISQEIHDRGVAARRHLEARVHGTPTKRDGHAKWAVDRVEQGLGN